MSDETSVAVDILKILPIIKYSINWQSKDYR